PKILSLPRFDITPVSLPPEAHTPGLRAVVLENHLRTAERQIAAARQALAQARKTLAEFDKTRQETVTSAGKPIVREDFGSVDGEGWERKGGRWVQEGGKLLQQQDGANRGVLRLQQAPPADFEARFKFTILGGQTWKSVGLAFD